MLDPLTETKHKLGFGSKFILFLLIVAFLYAGICIYLAWKDGAFEVEDRINICNPAELGGGLNKNISIFGEVNWSGIEENGNG
jgi:hypothetical protein